MYVEDDTDAQKHMKAIFEDLVSEFYQAYDGKKGLKLYEEKKPDIILSDVNMPVMNGREFLEAIRADSTFDDVKVIMQTTETGKAEIKAMMGLGISGYLMKPYQTTKVIELMVQLAPIVGYELLES